MILENCPITTIVRSLIVYSTIQYGTIVIMVYDSKCQGTLPRYTMSYSVGHKNVMMLSDWQQCYIFVLQQHAHRGLYTMLSTCIQYMFVALMNLVRRGVFGCPVHCQPSNLHNQRKTGAYSRAQLPPMASISTAIGSVPRISGHKIAWP